MHLFFNLWNYSHVYFILHFFALTSLIAGLVQAWLQEQRRSQLTLKWFSRITTFFRKKKHVHQQFEEGSPFYISWRLLFYKSIYVMNVYTLFIHVWRPLSVALSVMTSHTLIFLSYAHHFFLFSSFCFMNKMIQQQQTSISLSHHSSLGKWRYVF